VTKIKYIVYLFDRESAKLLGDLREYHNFALFMLKYVDKIDLPKATSLFYKEGWHWEIPLKPLNEYIPEAPEVTFMVLSYWKKTKNGIISWVPKDIRDAWRNKKAKIIDYRPNEQRVREYKIFYRLMKRYNLILKVVEQLSDKLKYTFNRIFFTDAEDEDEIYRNLVKMW